jgi:hypothetical protein
LWLKYQVVEGVVTVNNCVEPGVDSIVNANPAYEDVTAYDDETAYEDVTAYDDETIFVSPEPSPLKYDAVIEPIKLIEPVLTVLVEINSSIDGPSEPDLARNTLPSVVFIANSPSCRLEFVGF